MARMYISEFKDISSSEKRFLMVWNDFLSDKKSEKALNYMDSDRMIEIVQEFCQKCRESAIERNNLLMHLWTLWSYGKISADHLNICLQIYDKSPR